MKYLQKIESPSEIREDLEYGVVYYDGNEVTIKGADKNPWRKMYIKIPNELKRYDQYSNIEGEDYLIISRDIRQFADIRCGLEGAQICRFEDEYTDDIFGVKLDPSNKRQNEWGNEYYLATDLEGEHTFEVKLDVEEGYNTYASWVNPYVLKGFDAHALDNIEDFDTITYGNYLVNMVFPSSLTFLDSDTLHYCDNVTSVTIPTSIITFQPRSEWNNKAAFWWCSNLHDIFYEGTWDEWCAIQKDIEIIRASWDFPTFTLHVKNGDTYECLPDGTLYTEEN